MNEDFFLPLLMLGLFYNLFKVVLLLVLPFALLLRGASYAHIEYGYSPWVCILLATIITSILMFIYFSFFYGKMTGRIGNFDSLKRRALIAFLLVLVYAVQGLLFMNNKNLKSPELKKEMMNLHPILRLGLSTLVFLDQDLVITDATRVKEDYKKMGLSSNSKSLHYKQASTGYAHAVDLRTKGKSELRNNLVKYYFEILGFNTLRHVGTADHLHISLYSEDAPHSK